MSNRAQINNLLDLLSSLALKLGLVALGLGTAYLLYVLFGGKLSAAASKADKEYLAQTAGIARMMFTGGAIAVLVGCFIRFFAEETTGLIMLVGGGVLYFLAPIGINTLTLETIHKNELYLSILKDFSTVGLICFVPGGLLLLRTIVVQFLRITSRQQLPQTEEEKKRGPRRTEKLYAHCWDMPQCNERVKKVCPAWQKRKSCWQVKAGCLCDQDVVRLALIERDREQGADVSQGLRTATQPKVILTPKQKKERCRVCTIYSEHQRQKFRIAAPLTIVAVLAVYVFVYEPLSAVLYGILEKTDKFMSFLTYRQGADASFAAQGQIVTTLAMICLGVVLLSFTLRALEYLIYELQV